VSFRIPTSLNVTVPLILLAFAAILSAVNLLYHVPQAERAAEEDCRKRLAQEVSRLRSTLEYLLHKGDEAAAQHEMAELAANPEYVLGALTDDSDRIIAATRRAWLGRPIAEVLPRFDVQLAAAAARERRGAISIGLNGSALLGYAGVVMAGERAGLNSSRIGGLYLAYDLNHARDEARAAAPVDGAHRVRCYHPLGAA
jgi:two-component system NtrC family sensor kinase